MQLLFFLLFGENSIRWRAAWESIEQCSVTENVVQWKLLSVFLLPRSKFTTVPSSSKKKKKKKKMYQRLMMLDGATPAAAAATTAVNCGLCLSFWQKVQFGQKIKQPTAQTLQQQLNFLATVQLQHLHSTERTEQKEQTETTNRNKKTQADWQQRQKGKNELVNCSIEEGRTAKIKK